VVDALHEMIQQTWTSDLNRLAEWCEANALELNVGKCKSITFSRLCHPIEFLYMLGGITLIVLTLSMT
jgi:hypothetical protein